MIYTKNTDETKTEVWEEFPWLYQNTQQDTGCETAARSREQQREDVLRSEATPAEQV